MQSNRLWKHRPTFWNRFECPKHSWLVFGMLTIAGLFFFTSVILLSFVFFVRCDRGRRRIPLISPGAWPRERVRFAGNTTVICGPSSKRRRETCLSDRRGSEERAENRPDRANHNVMTETRDVRSYLRWSLRSYAYRSSRIITLTNGVPLRFFPTESLYM